MKSLGLNLVKKSDALTKIMLQDQLTAKDQTIWADIIDRHWSEFIEIFDKRCEKFVEEDQVEPIIEYVRIVKPVLNDDGEMTADDAVQLMESVVRTVELCEKYPWLDEVYSHVEVAYQYATREFVTKYTVLTYGDENDRREED